MTATAGLAAEPPPAQLSETQEAALARIESLLAGGGGNVLLAGATGSGKTEVYIRACEAALAAGRGAIVLVPEIALTPQTLGRFRARFGDRVALLHSGLSEAERRDERERIVSGEATVVVGARSAVFAPLPSLGVICVDEEHDASYKQESDPRYDARTVAAKRAALEGAVAIFGSATPRPESWQALERLELGGRIAAPMPTVRVVDLRQRDGLPALGAAPRRARPARGETAARRSSSSTGAASRPRCTAAPAASPAAARTATSRSRSTATARCAATTAARASLPARRARRAARRSSRASAPGRRSSSASSRSTCRSWSGSGSTPTRSRSRRSSAPRSSGSPRADRAVLVGTQMVAKGHHFAGVELAAVVDADTGLGLPDFRAEERTFQLLTQLAGRSGRDAPGRVIVQTFQPESRAVEYAARHDVAGFLAGELERRRALGYPPFRHLVRIVVSGPEHADATRALEELKAGLPEFELLGPAPLLRLRGRHRAQLVGKTDRPRALASRAAALLAAAAPAMRRAGLAAVVDVDPQSV